MAGKLLVRGMLAGIAAGLLTFCFARVVGEPQVDHAIAFEEQLDAAKSAAQGDSHGAMGGMSMNQAADASSNDAAADGHDHEVELVSRSTQAGLGLLTGVVVYGAAFGGLFSLTFAYAWGRVGRVGPRALSAWLAAGAFVALVVVPNLKYPANPPSVGNPDTIGFRTGLFFLMIAISLAVMVFSLNLRRHLLARLGTWNASIAAGFVFVVVIAAIQLSMPVIDEVPAAFPAVTLWKFRVAALGMQTIMWVTIGLLFGALVERSRLVGQAGKAGQAA